jgi:hypothetical protein
MAARKKAGRKRARRTNTGASAVPQPRLTAQDRRWRAQGDLATLTSAEEIKADSSRLSAARTEAKRQAKAAEKATR